MKNYLIHRFNKIFFLLILFIVLMIGISCNDSFETIEKQDDDIIKMQLVSYDGKSESYNFIKSLGHSFIVLENISDEEIEFFTFKIRSNEMITFSWWAIDIHMGVWFNIEPYFINEMNRYDQRYSVIQYLNYEDLSNINDFITKYDYYNPLDNCAKRCLEVWNLCADDMEKIDETIICNPTYLCNKIKNIDCHNYNSLIDVSCSIGYFDIDKKMFKEYELVK